MPKCMGRSPKARKIIDSTLLRIGSLREIAHLVMPDELDADTRSCARRPRAWITNPEGGNVAREELFDELYALEPDGFYVAMSVG